MRTARLLVAGIFFIVPAVASAQAKVLIAPSASAGLTFDDNLFSTPDEEALGDEILRVTPGLSASRETPHTYWFGGYSFDAERYQDHPTLTTPMARQTAGALARIATSPRTAFTLAGGYDSTVTPSELNATTGLFAGRMRAWRWRAAPEITHALTPTSTLTLNYDVTADTLQDERIVTHGLGAAFVRGLGVRDELRLEPFIREFVFRDSMLGVAGGLVGWTHRFTPVTSLRLRGGPRFVQHSDRAEPELDLLLQRRTEYSEWGLSYVRSMTTALGLNDVIDTQRFVARAGYHHPAVLDVTLEGGVYVNEYTTTARVYRLSADVTRALAPALAISVGYSLNLQRGLFNALALAGPVGDGLDAPTLPLLLPDTLVNVPLRKNVLSIRFVVAPTIKPVRQPPDTRPGPGSTSTERNP